MRIGDISGHPGPVPGLQGDLRIRANRRKLCSGGHSGLAGPVFGLHAVHRTLRAALTSARKSGLIATNPAQDAELARAPKYHAKTWTAAQAKRFLQHSKDSGDRNAPLWRFLLATGARRGEALGAQWADLDLDNGFVLIHRNLSEVGGKVARSTPKTNSSRRTVPLDADTVTMLRAWQDRLTVERATAPIWHGDPEVFVNELGQHHGPDRISKLFGAACKAAGVPRIRLHDTRHSAASLWLGAGVGIKDVSSLLGHSSIAITGDIYGHSLPESARAASDKLGEWLS